MGLILCASQTGHSAVLIKSKQWPQGSVLNVVFLDGDKELHQLVQQIAPLWLDKTNLTFRFFSDLEHAPVQTHIRVSFTLHSGSRLGDHQDYLSKHATMNLHALSLNQLSDRGMQRLILHEFGHALGFEHEYRSGYWPYNDQPIEQIMQECQPKMVLIGFSQSTAVKRCRIVNAPVNSDTAYLTAYDERSIMNYPMTFLMSDGTTKQIVPAVKLSLLDRYSIQQWYSR